MENRTNEIEWKSDRWILNDLVFRLVNIKNDDWELGDQCFQLYKSKRMMDQYEAFWTRYQNFQASHVLELGIYDGGSIALWQELWDARRFVGIDIKERGDSTYFTQWKQSRGLEERVKTYWGVSQTDHDMLLKIFHEDFNDHLDLVIDDASHMYNQTKASFETLFPLLHPGGLYIIEDYAWGCVPHLPLDFPLPHGTELLKLVTELMEATGSKVRAITGHHITGRIHPLISKMEIYPDFVVVERGDGNPPEGGFKLESYITHRPLP
jgi:cephalosporin hydroxylase